MPVGYLILILLIAGFALLQLIPVPRNPLVRVASFWTSMVVNEQPHWFAMLLLASTGLAIASGDIDSPAGWLLVGAAAIAVIGLIAIAWMSFPKAAWIPEAIRFPLNGLMTTVIGTLAIFLFGWLAAAVFDRTGSSRRRNPV